jgi:DNA-binding response OmpR family regulator
MSSSILVVDDEQNLRNTLAFILKRAGYYVTTTESAHEALSVLKTGSFDLMILDLKMPDVDGITLLKKIRDKHPHLPVFILTAYGSLDSAIDALRLEARDYLRKPIDPAQLLDRIQKTLNEEQNNQRRSQIMNKIQYLMTELEGIDQENHQVNHVNQDPLVPSRFIRKGCFQIDLKARFVEVNQSPVHLPPSAFNYLLVLLRHAPDSVGYQSLVSEAQGKIVSDAEARSLARWQIYQIRKAVEVDLNHPQYIFTVRNFGYRLITDYPSDKNPV